MNGITFLRQRYLNSPFSTVALYSGSDCRTDRPDTRVFEARIESVCSTYSLHDAHKSLLAFDNRQLLALAAERCLYVQFMMSERLSNAI